MRDPNNRINGLAELALSVTHNDVAAAVRLLCEWTGLSFEFAFEAVDASAKCSRWNPTRTRHENPWR
jgi:hypothetical protein